MLVCGEIDEGLDCKFVDLWVLDLVYYNLGCVLVAPFVVKVHLKYLILQSPVEVQVLEFLVLLLQGPQLVHRILLLKFRVLSQSA